MTELKTLNDLKMDAGEVADRVTWGDEIVEVEELKAEAVKWVKYYEKEGNVSAIEIMGKQDKSFGKEGKQYFDDEVEMWMTAKIISFITFFNLTEEDLK